MPIVVNIETGAIKAPEYTKEQKDRAWEAVTKAWANANKDRLRSLSAECASGPRGK